MSKCETLVATPQLRWVRKAFVYDVLQQYWTDPLGVSGVGEWRDVPTVSSIETQPLTESPVVHCEN